MTRGRQSFFLVFAILAILAFALGAALAQTNQSLCVQFVSGSGITCPPVSAGNPLPVGGAASATTNLAGSVTTGGTFQLLVAASASRKSIEFQNVCTKTGNCSATTDNCYLFFGATASATTATSILVTPGLEYLRASGVVPSDNVAITCDSTGDKFYAAAQ